MPHMVRRWRCCLCRGLIGLIDGVCCGTTNPREIGKPKEGTVAIDLSGGSSQMDYAEHGRMYGQFLLFTKIAIVFLVLLLAGMGYFLT
jgi:aa3 type cytochrome c oxidase subunit IV